jgi:hypothetical protein
MTMLRMKDEVSNPSNKNAFILVNREPDNNIAPKK